MADVAQLVEHSLGKGEVISSILIIGSRLRRFAGVTLSGSRRGEPAAEIPSVLCEGANGSKGGSNSVVESQPSKLLVAGSIPVSRSRDLVQGL